MPVHQAKVKSVLSGDTLILSARQNPSQERTLSLAFVSAPRMKRDGDEVGQHPAFNWVSNPGNTSSTTPTVNALQS